MHISALDLYAKIEPLIDFYDEYEKLYSSYLHFISTLNVKSVLDVGCGNGKFVKLLQDNDFDALGIDRSQVMINRAKKLNINVSNTELSEIPNNSYDCVVCIGDVLNYMQDDDLKTFLDNISTVLKNGGYFLADINTLLGFKMSDGSMIKNRENEFLAIDATFEDKILTTDIVYFEKNDDRYQKNFSTIYQYYHPLSFFKKLSKLHLLHTFDISMFSDEIDKKILVFENHTDS
ncbi:MAG: class I SAM-dependent methyltransferase [Sulfurospirillaceae bacterium]|nr:class I SAM-dependent methyltransferase [Sulfurospirillaceae bacterium]